jgi:pyruvate dehydrogenase E2 component (dihydrolipoamide acetyltransferase)
MFRILLARQGQTMERGTLVRWCKQEGEDFQIGEDLYEIETEKVIVAIQATRPGRLLRAVAAPDETVPVGALLAIAADPNEKVSGPQIDALIRTGSDEPFIEAVHTHESQAEASAPRLAQTIAALPKARALAKELGVELSAISGSGAEGVITPDDVRLAARSRPVVSAQIGSSERTATETPTDSRVIRSVALSPIGRSIFRALERGTLVPQFTQGILVDATELVRRKKAARGELTYMDFFLDALVHAAREVPDVLARASEREIHYFGSIDISLAVATESGLLLAVLRDAGATTITARSPAWRSLAERARSGRLSPTETTGGIIALSNLGTRGVDYGTSLLPADHAAIVFFGSLQKRAIVIGDTLEARPTVHVSVTYDHRVVDGILGARFTTAIRGALEGP